MKRPRSIWGSLSAVEPAEYLALGTELIPTLLEAEMAAPWLEIEARLADNRYPGASHPVDPHHLSNARRQLEEAGLIQSRIEGTRGGRAVTLWMLTGVRSGQKAVERAAARKRLLTARYLGWSQGHPVAQG
jgi:hypothetical protein